MFAQRLARRLARADVHYGWVIVGVVFILALTSQGSMGVSGALIVLGGVALAAALIPAAAALRVDPAATLRHE